MADFCRQCTKEIFCEDDSDFVLEGTNEPAQAMVLCEGCGYILVNAAGTCIDPHCIFHDTQAKQMNGKKRLNHG